MRFVDTGAWYAAYVPTDPAHAAIEPLIDCATTRLITTDFVLAESLTLLRARNEQQRAIRLGRDLLAQGPAEMVHLTPRDLEQAFLVFSTYLDKARSFVDCTSYIVMQRLGIREAIALDQHFRQMSGIAVFP
jgi:predicted nucleic acid-binding protein